MSGPKTPEAAGEAPGAYGAHVRAKAAVLLFLLTVPSSLALHTPRTPFTRDPALTPAPLSAKSTDTGLRASTAEHQPPSYRDITPHEHYNDNEFNDQTNDIDDGRDSLGPEQNPYLQVSKTIEPYYVNDIIDFPIASESDKARPNEPYSYEDTVDVETEIVNDGTTEDDGDRYDNDDVSDEDDDPNASDNDTSDSGFNGLSDATGTRNEAADNFVDYGSNEQDMESRSKRSVDQELNKTKARRVVTGDTVLRLAGGSRPPVRLLVHAQPPPQRPQQQQQQRQQPPEQQPWGGGRALVAAAGSVVRLRCDNHSEPQWFKDDERAWPARCGRAFCVVVSRATAGRWTCAGETTTIVLYERVRAVSLAVDGRRLDAGNTWVPAVDTSALDVSCTAEGGVPAPRLSWLLEAWTDHDTDTNDYLHVNNTIRHDGFTISGVRVVAARELHNATLRCVATQDTNSSSGDNDDSGNNDTGGAGDSNDLAANSTLQAQLQIHVTYGPLFVISRWPALGATLWAGAAAALTCDTRANPRAHARWHRDTGPLQIHHSSNGPRAVLRWPSLSREHAGWYRCIARWNDHEYSSVGYYLNVREPDPSSEPPETTPLDQEETPEPLGDPPEPERQTIDVPLGGNAQLHCPNGSVGCWWRRRGNSSSDASAASDGHPPEWAPAGSKHAHGVLSIQSAVHAEAGEYVCVGASRGEGARLRELKRVTLGVTGAASARALSAASALSGAAKGSRRLACGVCGVQVSAAWLVKGGRMDAIPAKLLPDPEHAPHCWVTEITVHHHLEVWCVAASPNGGSVVVFAASKEAPSPSDARPLLTSRGASIGVCWGVLLASLLVLY